MHPEFERLSDAIEELKSAIVSDFVSGGWRRLLYIAIPVYLAVVMLELLGYI
jgi:hypothetical protein